MRQASKEKKLKKVLVVDDDSKMRTVLSEFLRKNYNIQIIEAENGLDAISKTFKNKYCSVISDLEMPEMNGIEFMGYLRTKSEFDKVPKFILTSNRKIICKERAKIIGINAFLSKPFKSKELKKHFDKIFEFI